MKNVPVTTNHAIRPLPTDLGEARMRGWDELDIIFVTGDAYIDHPAFGVPLLARWLESHGFRVGIIAQPDWRSREAFMALGRPRLFFAVTAGAMDSMVAHYTPQKKLRHDDAYTPGGRHGARPNRATIIYTSRIKEAYRDVPVIIGGIEASLRRFAHYDFWENKVRRSLLLDAKADLLIYGMAERPLLELAQRMRTGESPAAIQDLRGSCFLARTAPDSAIELPAFDDVAQGGAAFVRAFRLIEQEQNPWCAKTVVQRHGDRLLIVLPPALPLAQSELDAVYALPYTREPHPSYRESVPAFEQIKLSITLHRGCYGGCSFCAIAQHQGKFIQSRSESSVLAEVRQLAAKQWFRGSLSDLGGPTANMYGTACGAPDGGQQCKRPSCLFPAICRYLRCNDDTAVRLIRKVRTLPAVQHLYIASGVRHDLLEKQPDYFRELVYHHVGGLLKVAPEQLVDTVTTLMRKPGGDSFERFLELFRNESRRCGKRQSVVPYLMAGHPGCRLDDMVELAGLLQRLGLTVEQVQEFTPTPGTAATCMFLTGIDPTTGQKVYVARTDRERKLQKLLLLRHLPEEQAKARKMLVEMGRSDLVGRLKPVICGSSTGRGMKKPR